MSCDISFKNKNAVHNSNFIKDIIGSHKTILEFAKVIRYWALRQSLAGGVVGSGGLHINNYALTMLIIFFFQIQNIMPPVRRLQENMKTEEIIKIDGWEFGINKIELDELTHNMHKTLNSDFSWIDYLDKFFCFYLNFDYESMVISPYAGKAIPRKAFQDLSLLINDPKDLNLKASHANNNTDDVDKDLIRYWEQIRNGQIYCLNMSSPLCVQDPFEQNFCVSRGFSKVGILNWRNQCRLALEYLKESDACSKSGILGLIKISVPAPKNKKEQFEIIKRIQSATGNKISLPAPKIKTKTRTGKPKVTTPTADSKSVDIPSQVSKITKEAQEEVESSSSIKVSESAARKKTRPRKRKPKSSTPSVNIEKDPENPPSSTNFHDSHNELYFEHFEYS